MLKKLKYAAAVAALSLLAACGGGSSGPVASTSAFNVVAAYVGTFTNPSANTFSVTGTSGSNQITGSGTATTGNVTSGTFEGLASLQRTTTVTGSFSVNGTSYPLASSSVSWTDSNYVPRGESGGSE